MNDKNKTRDPLPDEFATYEEAAEFWDTHDSTDYLDILQPVAVEDAELRERRYEIELDEDVVLALRKQARQKGTTTSHLASELLRQKILPTI